MPSALPADVVPAALAVVATGVGATAIHDAWTWLRRATGVASPDWALVGRWIAWLPRGRFVHTPIAAAPPVRHERALGWSAHYAIGIGFAALPPAIAGAGWLQAPTPGPALLAGALTVLAPFLLLHPGLGAGLFARRASRPWRTRFHSLVAHLVFGAGLYLAALAWRALAAP